MTSANTTSCCKRMGTPLVPPQKPPLLQLLLLPPPPLGSRARSQLWQSPGVGGGLGTRDHPIRQPPFRWVPVHPFHPQYPRCVYPGHLLQPQVVPGSLSCQNGNRPSPVLVLLVREGEAWPASAYSFKFCLLLNGSKAQGWGAWGPHLNIQQEGPFPSLPSSSPFPWGQIRIQQRAGGPDYKV